MDNIENLRKEIDDIDTKLMELINKRAKVARNIGLVKQEMKIAVLQENRERLVFDHVMGLAKDISKDNAKIIWRELMSACKQVQGKINRVSYLGPEGTFSQKAALEYFPKGNTEFIPAERKYEIFDEVERKECNFGIVPVENSLHGSVSETLDLLIERNVKVYGELELPIVHNLIGNKDAIIDNIKKVFSHAVVFPQVRLWLKKKVPNAELIETSSTAKAVQIIAENDENATSVAIGTSYAAELYNLSILAKNLQDNNSNFTRFLIISLDQQPPSENDKTSMVFVTKHTPGALFNILKYFADSNINLTKLESRPRKRSKTSVWEYIFLVDFDGHVNDVEEVLKKVNEQAIWMKILGSYPKSNV